MIRALTKASMNVVMPFRTTLQAPLLMMPTLQSTGLSSTVNFAFSTKDDKGKKEQKPKQPKQKKEDKKDNKEKKDNKDKKK